MNASRNKKLDPPLPEDDSDFLSAPDFATLRTNSSQVPKSSVKEIIGSLFNGSFSIDFHPEMPDVLVLSRRIDNGDLDIEETPIAIVSAECGNAVLRGADVFCPGVIALDGQALVNRNVSVFADRLNSVCKGSKCSEEKVSIGEETTNFVFVGAGTLLVSRDELFGSTRSKEQVVCKGVAVKMQNQKLPSFESLPSNMFFAQNFPSLACTHILNPDPNDFVLDMCAAPGGKSGHIASRMVGGTGCLISVDRSQAKVDKILQHFKDWSMDLNRCLVFTADSSKPKFITSLLSDNNGRSFQMRQELFDKVLLDAPCSGLGKRPYIQRDLDIPKLGTFHGFQRKFVFNAVQLLKPGGVLVYSTCTTRLEENENQVAWILETFPDILELVPCEPNFAKHGRSVSALDEKYLDFVQYFPPKKTDGFVWHPCESDTVGFFIAKFKKLSK